MFLFIFFNFLSSNASHRSVCLASAVDNAQATPSRLSEPGPDAQATNSRLSESLQASTISVAVLVANTIIATMREHHRKCINIICTFIKKCY